QLAALFPGQGAQYVNMLRDLACRFPAMQQTLSAADAALLEEMARPLSEWLYPHTAFDDAERARQKGALRATEVTQPALGAVSLGALRVLETFGVTPEAALGHSYGELVALCAAGRLTEEQLHRLSRLRGILMAAGEGDRGSMLAVSHDLEAVADLVNALGLDLVLANRNAPNQVVLSGATAEIVRAEALLRDRGLRVVRLNVAAAFHSPLVSAASAPFAEALEAAALPQGNVPVWANSTAEIYPDSAADARALLAGQLTSPVEFVQAVESMYNTGVRTFLEIGPGRRLGNLVRAILEGRDGVTTLAVDASSGRQHGMLDLARVLAALAALGHPVALDRWDPKARVEPASSGRPRLLIPINGANIFKPPTPRPKRTTQPSPVRPSEPTPGPKQPSPRPNPKPHSPTQRTPSIPLQASGKAPSAHPSGSKTPLPAGPQRPQTAPVPSNGVATTHTHGQTNGVAPKRSSHGLSTAITTPHTRPATNGALPAAPHTWVPSPRLPQEETMSDDPRQTNPWLSQALQSTSASLEALMQMQAQTAQLHRQFLEGQDRATESFQTLLERQQQMFSTLINPVSAPSPTPPAIAPPPWTMPTAVVSQPAPHLTNGAASYGALSNGAAHHYHSRAATPSAAVHAPAPRPTGVPTPPQPSSPPAPQPDPLSIQQQTTPAVLPTAPSAPAHTAIPDTPATSPPPQEGPVSTPSPSVTGLSTSHVSGVLLGLVAEKTGYPVEMLELSMGLDSDLGIDSIKRVEILSALEEQLPQAPTIKPEHLGELQTLEHIVQFLTKDASVSQGTVLSTSITEGPLSAAEPSLVQAEATPQHANRVERYAPTWTDVTSAPSALDLGQGTVYVVAAEQGDASVLVSAFEEHDIQASVHAPLGAVGGATPIPDDLVGLVLVAPAAGATDALVARCFQWMRSAGPQLNAAALKGGALLATVSRLDGRFGMEGLSADAEVVQGGLAGLVKTAGHEWSSVMVRALDVAAEAPLAEPSMASQAVQCLVADASTVEMGIAADGRWGCVAVVPASIPRAREPFWGSEDRVVLSGGARGVTAAVAQAIAATGAELVLLGRSPLPEPEPEALKGLVDEAALKRALLAQADGPLSPQALGQQYRRLMADREIVDNIR
ncbi:MAG: acyltransferase domain-containing protein, partial [Myxococcota bacterium]